MIKYLMLLLIATSAFAADTTFIKFGPGLNTKNPIDTKLFAIGHQAPLFAFFDYQLESGFFLDNSGNGNQGSAFGNADIGLSIVNNWYYTKYFFGPAVISNPDARLGSNFQFNHDLEIGLKDKRGVGIGIGYKHLSDAGLSKPNEGRDFVNIKFSMPF